MKEESESQEIDGEKTMDEKKNLTLPAYGLAEDIIKTTEEEITDPASVGGSQTDRDENTVKYVTFFLGNEEYALPIFEVQEINRVLDITRVPNSPRFVKGVVNLRGRIIPVIELKNRLNLGEAEIGKDGRIVIAECGPKLLGLMVDRVSQVLNLSPEKIEATPSEAVSMDANYIRGLGILDDRMIIILDLEKVVGKEVVS